MTDRNPSPEAPAREGVAKALYLKLIDTLKPFAEVAEKLKHCHVVEICEPTPDNPSRNIIPMPREWFERAADDLEVIAIQLHSDGVLSEGQTAKLTGLDRVEVRKQVDALTPRHEAPAELLSNPQELEAPAEGAGERTKGAAELQAELDQLANEYGDLLAEVEALRAGEAVGVVHGLKADLNTAELPDGTLLYTHPAAPSADHAELTRLAEAAGEEALGNLLAVIHRDGGHRTLEVGVEQAAAEAEKIVANLLSSAPEAREGEAVGLDEAQRKAVERAAMDAGAYSWRNSRLAMVEGGKIIGYPAFSRADMAELARLNDTTAASSTDNLRIAVEALEPFRKVHDVVRSKPGAYILTGAAGITVSDVRRAAEALAALKAEGAK